MQHGFRSSLCDREMTDEEYEKIGEKKREGLLALKTERKVTLDKELEKMQLLSVKEANDVVFAKLASRDYRLILLDQDLHQNSSQIPAVGSCCLAGVVCGRTLYTANVGDSRAILGRMIKATGEVLVIQVFAEHNASIESVRQEFIV